MDIAFLMDATLAGRGDQVVVFGNGFCTRQDCWLPLTRYVPDGWRTLRYDYVGTTPRSHHAWEPARYDVLDTHAADLVDLLTTLDLHNVTFVGHSMSGMVGVLASLLAPERFGTLVLIGASPCYRNLPGYAGGFSDEALAALFAEVDADLAAWMSGFAPRALGRDSTDVQLREFLDSMRAMRPDMGRVMLRAMLLSDFRATLSDVHAPVTIMQSLQDVAVPVDVARFLASQLPTQSLHMLDIEGHLPHVTHPTIVGPILAEILRTSRPDAGDDGRTA